MENSTHEPPMDEQQECLANWQAIRAELFGDDESPMAAAA